MSSISKLSIRGIRSFSPDSDQAIEFYSPLTMIVGANGCGKTTIIECLKYACTGSLPPGARSGHSFVNDPAMTDATEVKANIKLRFLNKRKRVAVVIRSFQLTKKRTKVEFKALDGVIRTTDDDGEKVSLTQRCSELDKHIPDLLGVSAAVLENVIFCHQEDSCWPLGEGAVLKKRFDDIFESTRYSKALEAILKAKKEYAAKAKDIKAEVMESGAHLQSAQDMRRTLDISSDKKRQSEEDLFSVDEELLKLNDKLDRCQDVIKRWAAAEKDIQDLQYQAESIKKRLQDKRSSLELEYEESEEVLLHQIENFESQIEKKQQELLKLQRNLEAVSCSISNSRDEMNLLNTKRGEAKALEQQLVQKKSEYSDSVSKITSKLSISIPRQTFGTLEYNEFIKLVHKTVYDAEMSSNKMIQDSNVKLETQSNEIQKAKGEVQKISIEISNKEKELYEIIKEKEILHQSIIGGSKKSLAQLSKAQAQSDYDEAKRSFDEFMFTYNEKLSKCKNTIKDSTDRIRILSEEIAADDQVLQLLRANRSELERLSMQEKQTMIDEQSCQEELKILFDNKFRDILDGISIPSNSSDFYTATSLLEDKVNSNKTKLDVKRKELSSLRNEISKATLMLSQENSKKSEVQYKLAELNFNESSMKNLEIYIKELNDLQSHATSDNEMVISTKDDSLQILVERCQQTEIGIMQTITALESSKMWAEKFGKVATKSGACPCCDRKMNPNEKITFDTKVKKYFKGTPEMVADCKTHLANAQELTSKMTILKNSFFSSSELNNDIDLINIRISFLESQITEYQNKEKEINSEVDSLDTLKNRIEKCRFEINVLVRKREDITNRIKELNERRNRQSQSFHLEDSFKRSPNEIEELQRRRMEERDELHRKKEQNQIEDGRLSKQMLTLKGGLAELEKNLLEAKQKEEKFFEMESKLVEYEKRDSQIFEVKSVLKRDLNIAENELRTKENEYNKTKVECSKVEKDQTNHILSLKQEVQTFLSLSSSLEDLEKIVKSFNLKSISDQIDQIQFKIQENEDLIRELNPKIHSINSELTSQDRHKRTILENLNYRSLKKEHALVLEQLNDVKQKLGATDFSREYQDAQRKLQRLEQERQRLLLSKAEKNGALKEICIQISSIEQKLELNPYKNIDEAYRKANIKFETTSMAVADLDNYFSALDKALQTFHSLKIKEINKIIRELWQLTYRGEDIDMIELVSGQDSSGGENKAARSYNYRVMMYKGDTCLEMRGRCSAGQRVLAAVVIRLALAETFCLNCGILALDEPTTNLDEANKAGLAHALARIIATRTKQQNFQILTITHDEDFVRLISNELSSQTNVSMPEYYFRVSRQEEGKSGKFFSKIDRIPWEEM